MRKFVVGENLKIDLVNREGIEEIADEKKGCYHAVTTTFNFLVHVGVDENVAIGEVKVERVGRSDNLIVFFAYDDELNVPRSVLEHSFRFRHEFRQADDVSARGEKS